MIKGALAYGTVAVATVSGTWGALVVLDVRPVVSRDLHPIERQVEANTRSLMLQRWQWLNEKAKLGQLSPRERAEYCQLSRVLGFQVPGCA